MRNDLKGVCAHRTTPMMTVRKMKMLCVGLLLDWIVVFLFFSFGFRGWLVRKGGKKSLVQSVLRGCVKGASVLDKVGQVVGSSIMLCWEGDV